jgi:hypothetical protein
VFDGGTIAARALSLILAITVTFYGEEGERVFHQP